MLFLRSANDVTKKCIAGDGLMLAEFQTATIEDETLTMVLGYVQAQWPLKQQISTDLLA